MAKTISTTNANRSFPRLMRQVLDGDSFVVTSHGRPIARIDPIGKSDVDREAAYQALLKHLEEVVPIDGGRWTREELYER